MSRPSEGVRLWLQPTEVNADGSLRKNSVWVIRDGSRKRSTGCAPGDRHLAEQALAEYIRDKYQPARDKGRAPSEIFLADVLNIYLSDVAPAAAREAEVKQRVLKLAEWWGLKRLSDVNGTACREYVKWRTAQPLRAAKPKQTGKPARMVTAAGARRELEDFRAAINHHRREGLCSEVVEVVLPPKSAPRERWLTRSEAARLLWAAWKFREVQKGVRTDRASRRHIARFILVGIYTGTRSAAICGGAFQPAIGRGWVDLESGVFHRRAAGAKVTKKRQPPVRLPPRLLAHIKRWQAKKSAIRAIVEFNGASVTSVRKAFASVVKDAGLGPEVTPHILRHTCATWLMQAGVDIWDAAGFLGMTTQQLEATYGHHHPDYQSSASEALGGQNGDRNTVNKARQAQTAVIKIGGK